MKRTTPLCILVWSLLLVGVPWSVAQEKQAPSSLVITQEGSLPIILSAPHGGSEAITGVPERKGDGLAKGPSGFVVVRDTNTDRLARELADAVEKKMGKKPYLVVAKFARKFVDANRPPDIAFEHADAKPVYEAYHGTLTRYSKEVQKAHGRGLLLDIHGQGFARDTIFRGTKDGKTVKLLVERFGGKAHVGPRSFFGLLGAGGFKVHPLDDGKEQAGYTGGFIVQNYGSHTGYGIDAIQLEFGGDYRDQARLKDSAVKLADAIDAFAKLYLLEKTIP